MTHSENLSLIDFLDSDSYQTYNRNIARYCKSVNAAIILAELANRFKYHSKNKELTDSSAKYGAGWFYYTFEHCEERTCLAETEQKNAIKILEELGFISKCQMAMPAKRYFKIHLQKISEVFLFSNNFSRTDVSSELERTFHPNKNGRNVRTAHIYKNPIEEPNKNTTTKPPPEKKEDNPKSVIAAAKDISLTYKNIKGEAKQVSQSDVFTYFLKLPYSTEEIQLAIEQVRTCNDFIGNIFKYLEAICLRIHNSKSLKINDLRKKTECVKKEYPPQKTVTMAEFLKRKSEENQEKNV